jgi:ribonuclease III
MPLTPRHPLDLAPLQERIGYRFRDESLLITALTHSSFAYEQPQELRDNERLEFLGDAVLGMIVADMLFQAHDEPEGVLSAAKHYLVSAPRLRQVAEEIGLGPYLLLGHGEELTQGRRKESVLENALEALIGAVYLDGGIDAARRLTADLFGEAVREHQHEDVRRQDFKSYLQEMLQARGLPTPDYTVVSTSGPDHAKQFHVTLSIGGSNISEGEGPSKKSAEQAAAADLLTQIEKGAFDLSRLTD